MAEVELTSFQVDLLVAVDEIDDRFDRTGQDIKRKVQSDGPGDSGEINNGRLYQNLNYLLEEGLLQKGFVDGRTNTYSLTSSGRVALEKRREWVVA